VSFASPGRPSQSFVLTANFIVGHLVFETIYSDFDPIPTWSRLFHDFGFGNFPGAVPGVEAVGRDLSATRSGDFSQGQSSLRRPAVAPRVSEMGSPIRPTGLEPVVIRQTAARISHGGKRSLNRTKDKKFNPCRAFS
jgi:hypothetical protein